MLDAEVLGYMAYRIANAPVQSFPFPHIYVENVFPRQFYDELRDRLPIASAYSGIEGKFHGRTFYDPSSLPLLQPLATDTFTDIAKWPFRKYIDKRFPTGFKEQTDLRLVLDGENYQIGPHTDAQYKVLSLLFYIPNVTTTEDLGTSIYLPRDQSFRCAGGPHHKHEDFIRIHTAPFRQNTLLAFFKTNYSFHGVEPITIPCRRDVLLWNLYDRGK